MNDGLSGKKFKYKYTNIQKSQCMIINKKEPKPDKISDCEMMMETEYLGITIKLMKSIENIKLKCQEKLLTLLYLLWPDLTTEFL